MLACIAEGKNFDNEEEGTYRRGATLSCDLTHEDIAKVMMYQEAKDLKSVEYAVSA